jgi:hypothetical protein
MAITLRPLLGLAGPAILATVQVPDRATLSWHFPSEISLHAPLTAELALTNGSKQDVSVLLGAEGVEVFWFDLVGPDGVHHVVVPQFPQGPVRGGVLKAKPGERFAETILLSEWLDLQQVGEYSLVIHASTQIMYGPPDLQGILAPTFEWRERITVVPRDPEMLSRTCEALLHRALDQENLGDAEFSMRELSFIRDPLAVPFLLQAAHGKWWFSHAIDGLGRIAGPESTAALQQLAADPDQRVAKQAREVLARRK